MSFIILDRDGVINHESANYIKSADEWHALPGSLEAISRFSRAGWRIAVASNQSGLGRGLFSLHELAAMHAKLARQLAALGGRIDGVFFCPHAPPSDCDCRKPRCGLYREIERYFGISIAGVPSVGDSLRDLQAAREAGARPVLVQTGNGTKTQQELPTHWSVDTYKDLKAVADSLLKE